MTNAYSNRKFFDVITAPAAKPDRSFRGFQCQNPVNFVLLFISAVFYHYINFFLEEFR
jgi:hypothetical protein